MKRRKLLALLLMLMVSIAIQAQNVTASGTVVDANGEPIIGASVVLVGNGQVGTITDIDGHYQLAVPTGSKLQISYIGYETQTVKATANARVTVQEDNKMLNDVVVVGYGVQKKSVVTAAIAKVTSDDIAGKGVVRMDNALKGLAAGVNVTSNSGQPGTASRVRVRGIGTINNTDPLYIVDGMPLEGGLDLVNPNDIESIEVLKDAASAAIYGTRGANGVILITTKKGKAGSVKVNYNGSYGWSSAAKHRDVTSATDYAILQNEYYLNGGQAQKYADPYNLTDSNGNAITGFGTDWQSLVFNDNAPQQNHDVSISGGSDAVQYYASVGYYQADGIVGGNYGQSNYDRLTISNSEQIKLMDRTKERIFLNKADLSINVKYMNVHSTGISTNSEYGSILGSALYMSPLLCPTVTNADAAAALINKYSAYDLPRDANGNPYTIPGDNGTYQEMNNPLALLSATTPSKGWAHHFLPSVSLEVQLVDNLKFHTQFSADLSFWGSDGAVKTLYYFSGNNNASNTQASSSKSQSVNLQIENYLSYDKTFGKHSLGVTVGQSALRSRGSYLSGWRYGLINTDKPSIDYTNSVVEYQKDSDGNIIGATVPYGTGGGYNTEHRMFSLFGRLSYNYDERYMIQGIIRRDGSSRFGANHKYGVFPSVSAGWNVMNEAFMRGTSRWLSNFKIRASWGKNGNDNIGDFNYAAYSSSNNNYLFGTSATKYIGSKSSIIPNPDLHWEESEQLDFGVDLGFFSQALTFTFDWFNKKTNGMIITRPIPSYTGETSPQANVGDMSNSGFEFELGYKWHIADAHFALKANASYLHNELNNLGNAEGFLNLDTVQGISEMTTRAENGQAFPFFYGYKTDGILQNPEEAAEYNAKYGLDRVPGDVRFVDVNGDGTIDTNDRTNIGNGSPDWTFGINFNADWKGFDLTVFAQGVQGADIFDATYRSDVYSGNYPTWMLGRWTGEGTSTKYPRLSSTGSYNWVGSDLYICDGSYFRIKTIQLGYTFPSKLTKKIFVDRLRIFGSVDNLVTWTKYWGYDPEIASGGTSLGIDKGVYPQARTWTVGVNLTLAGATKKADKEIVYTPSEPQIVEKVVEKIVEKPVTKEVVKEVVKEVPTTNNMQVVNFAQGKYELTKEAKASLDKVKGTASVVAYASPEGNPEANKVLSENRAKAIADYLTSKGVTVKDARGEGAPNSASNRIAIIVSE